MGRCEGGGCDGGPSHTWVGVRQSTFSSASSSHCFPGAARSDRASTNSLTACLGRPDAQRSAHMQHMVVSHDLSWACCITVTAAIMLFLRPSCMTGCMSSTCYQSTQVCFDKSLHAGMVYGSHSLATIMVPWHGRQMPPQNGCSDTGPAHISPSCPPVCEMEGLGDADQRILL